MTTPKATRTPRTSGCSEPSPGFELSLLTPRDAFEAYLLHVEGHPDRHLPESRFLRYADAYPFRGLTARSDSRLVGLLLYRFDRGPTGPVRLVDVSVEESSRRKGVASVLLLPLLSSGNGVTAAVRESNLPGQLLLKSLGFTCTRVLAGHFACPREDGYYFRSEPRT